MENEYFIFILWINNMIGFYKLFEPETLHTSFEMIATEHAMRLFPSLDDVQ
jgi:hypothetical protein